MICPFDIKKVLEVDVMIYPEEKKPYFIYAYWPLMKAWKIQPEKYETLDDVDLQKKIEYMKQVGWLYISVMKIEQKKGG